MPFRGFYIILTFNFVAIIYNNGGDIVNVCPLVTFSRLKWSNGGYLHLVHGVCPEIYNMHQLFIVLCTVHCHLLTHCAATICFG